ncbi:hypothetical protein ABZ565_32480 [Streptomyces sp. NPDC016469]|uniref:hypothetical protein n=1 Tax=Streptomyces sp. NPDC016469 TaxID=3157191 RepID=UPI0033EF4854
MQTKRQLPAVASLSQDQQRGWHCVWCRAPLTVGDDQDLGEQRARPTNGAAYSWFPRACKDAAACAGREGEQTQ